MCVCVCFRFFSHIDYYGIIEFPVLYGMSLYMLLSNS